MGEEIGEPLFLGGPSVLVDQSPQEETATSLRVTNIPGDGLSTRISQG